MNKRYFSFYFFVYLVLFLMIDYLNESMKGLDISIRGLNLLLTLVMSFLSAYLLTLSHDIFKRSGFQSKGENFSYLSVLFGILTYGCTPCVIAFFASIGISFSVIALPLGGMPYKLFSLGLILFGIYWSRRDLKCKIGGNI